eukprot:750120-Hanusia_phi.AAC.2
MISSSVNADVYTPSAPAHSLCFSYHPQSNTFRVRSLPLLLLLLLLTIHQNPGTAIDRLAKSKKEAWEKVKSLLSSSTSLWLQWEREKLEKEEEEHVRPAGGDLLFSLGLRQSKNCTFKPTLVASKTSPAPSRPFAPKVPVEVRLLHEASYKQVMEEEELGPVRLLTGSKDVETAGEEDAGGARAAGTCSYPLPCSHLPASKTAPSSRTSPRHRFSSHPPARALVLSSSAPQFCAPSSSPALPSL